MPKPKGAVWSHVAQVWRDIVTGRWSGEDMRGQVLVALECGHWRTYKLSRAPHARARVVCERCTADHSLQPVRNRHGVLVYPRGTKLDDLGFAKLPSRRGQQAARRAALRP
jgi:hypothetical protein